MSQEIYINLPTDRLTVGNNCNTAEYLTKIVTTFVIEVPLMIPFTSPEVVFLVVLGTSSFPARHDEVYGKTTGKLFPSCEQARTEHD